MARDRQPRPVPREEARRPSHTPAESTPVPWLCSPQRRKHNRPRQPQHANLPGSRPDVRTHCPADRQHRPLTVRSRWRTASQQMKGSVPQSRNAPASHGGGGPTRGRPRPAATAPRPASIAHGAVLTAIGGGNMNGAPEPRLSLSCLAVSVNAEFRQGRHRALPGRRWAANPGPGPPTRSWGPVSLLASTRPVGFRRTVYVVLLGRPVESGTLAGFVPGPTGRLGAIRCGCPARDSF